MFNYDRIMETIIADSAILALLDGFGLHKAVFGNSILPKEFDGTNSINFYNHIAIDPTIEYEDEFYTLNCRAASFSDAKSIQLAVKNAFNRKSSHNDGFYTVMVMPIIPPADETDTYNGPVEVRIRKR